MFNDLYVNGTSVATGFGLGKEVIGFGNAGAWPHLLAEKYSAGSLWNHSVPSKPVELSVRDQIGFCSQYLQQGNKAENLFTIIEFLLPHHPLLQPLFESDSKVIFPIIYQKDPSTVSINSYADKYLSYFVETSIQPNYLDPFGQVYTISDTVDTDLRIKHEDQKADYYDNQHSLSSRLYKVGESIIKLQQWLEDKNIKYLMFWACGGDELKNNNDKYSKIVDKFMSVVPQQHKLIPMSQFSCMNYGVTKSLKPNDTHPDAVGHYAIAEYLDKYIISNRIQYG